jgi:hypothetical protein
MATTKTTKPASKKSSSAVKKKVSNILTGPLKDTKKAAGKAIAFGVKAAKSGAKTYIESEKRMVKQAGKGVKKGVKAVGKLAGNTSNFVKNAMAKQTPKMARGGVAKKMRKFQSEGETMEGAPKPTTPSVTTSPTPVSRPAATTPTPTAPAATTPAATSSSEKSKLMSEMIAAGYNPRQIKKALGALEAGPKVRVDPNAVINAVGNVSSAAINAFGNKGGGGMSEGPFKKGGMVKRKLMKASEGVIVKMNGNQPVQKKAGSNGVKSGTNPKAKASKVTKGRSGGTSKAPKTALPKAGYGMMMKSGGSMRGKKSC